jgi:hypothetical protein
MTSAQGRHVLGWREWVGLPELEIARVKAKVDTGARTSTLHAFYVQTFYDGGRKRVRFGVHPDQNGTDAERHCVADVLDEREVTDSGGHRELRVFIRTPIVIGRWRFPIQITLTDRDTMRFRMLLGRTALRGRFIVDPKRSFSADRPLGAGSDRGGSG